MSIPKYVTFRNCKQYQKEHKELVNQLRGKVEHPYSVATIKLKKKYKN